MFFVPLGMGERGCVGRGNKDKEKKAEMGSRFMLRIGNEVIYAAEILKNPNECQVAISRELIRENFNILYSEWKTGKT